MDENAGQVNAIGMAHRSVHEIKDKWKNLQTTAKKEFARQRRSFGQTGGGPPCKKTKEATEKITRLFGNAPSFTGPHGFETSGKLKYNFWASLGHPRPQAQARAALTVALVQAVEQN
jgi:hypothetical protein